MNENKNTESLKSGTPILMVFISANNYTGIGPAVKEEGWACTLPKDDDEASEQAREICECAAKEGLLGENGWHRTDDGNEFTLALADLMFAVAQGRNPRGRILFGPHGCGVRVNRSVVVSTTPNPIN
jgi:hypothetical protein